MLCTWQVCTIPYVFKVPSGRGGGLAQYPPKLNGKGGRRLFFNLLGGGGGQAKNLISQRKFPKCR